MEGCGESRLATIHKSMHLIPAQYHQHIPSGTLDAAQDIQMETFYRCTCPLLSYFELEMPNTHVLYPLGLIIAFPVNLPNQHAVSIKTAEWVQSGGLRLVPLKTNSTDSDIKKWVAMTHCLIVPNCPILTDQDRDFLSRLMGIVREQQKYPVLALGHAAVALLRMSTKEDINQQYLVAQNAANFYVGYNNRILQDLGVRLRLAIENNKKILPPANRIRKSSNLEKSGYKSIAVCKTNNGELLYSILQSEHDHDMFLVFCDPALFENCESIALWHKFIANFVDLCKGEVSAQKTVNEKMVEKHLLATHKTVWKSQGRPFYQVL